MENIYRKRIFNGKNFTEEGVLHDLREKNW